MYQGFRCYCLQGRHNFGILYFLIMDLFTFTSFICQIELCAGVGVPLLCKAFGGFALTFSGNTYLIKICVLDFQSSINRLCVTFHIAIFSPYCCLYCLYEQSSAHISFALRVAVIMGKLKHKDIICLQIKILCDNLTIFIVTM